MMAGIASLLTSNSSVIAVAPGGIMPVLLVEGSTFPAITYQMVSGNSDISIAGNDIDTVRVQFDTWASTYAAADAASKAVKVALMASAVGLLSDGTRVLSVEPSTQMDIYEQDARMFRRMTEFIFQFTN